MNAEILTIGDELLIGQVINTNQAYIAERLNLAGVSIIQMTTVGDDLQAILTAYTGAWKRATFVIVTGGLGPTHDDITKNAVCKFFSTDLVPDAGVRRTIETLMKKRNLPWTPAAEEQTLMPRKARVIPNPIGTAAGMLFEEKGKYLFALPGVPYEMKEMLDASVIPFVVSKVTGSAIRHLTLRTTGIPESFLAQQLGNLDDVLEGARLAFLPSPRGVRLRVTVSDADGPSAEARIRGVEQRIRGKVEKYIYASGDVELEEVLGMILTEKKLTIAVAESCTGGLIASRLTDVSGSSKYFERGVVTYSNRSKIELLNVSAHLIEQHGTVCKEVAEAMADGIRKIARTDIGLSTTGIAGPTGGSEEKPVGLVWIGYADAKDTFAMKFNFGDGRTRIKERASQAALELVRRKTLKVD
jgi:nicotinamide-nucleotide amidase